MGTFNIFRAGLITAPPNTSAGRGPALDHQSVFWRHPPITLELILRTERTGFERPAPCLTRANTTTKYERGAAHDHRRADFSHNAPAASLDLGSVAVPQSDFLKSQMPCKTWKFLHRRRVVKFTRPVLSPAPGAMDRNQLPGVKPSQVTASEFDMPERLCHSRPGGQLSGHRATSYEAPDTRPGRLLNTANSAATELSSYDKREVIA